MASSNGSPGRASADRHRRPRLGRDQHTPVATPVRLGLRENLPQFSLLVVVNAFVGAMVGMERTILPPIAEQDFHLAAKTAVLSFIVVFGVTKAITNYLAGRLSDRFGASTCCRRLARRRAGAVPAHVGADLDWVLVANALLGVSQGLTWSTTVIMKIDLAGPRKRGLAMGLNEFAGYFARRGAARSRPAGSRRATACGPQPFYLGVVFVAARAALCRSSSCARHEHHVAHGVRGSRRRCAGRRQPTREVFWRTTLLDRTCRASARPAWSTTSTTAWRGACFRSSSPPRA